MIRRWLALTYYLYALRLAALSHFYFNPLYLCALAMAGRYRHGCGKRAASAFCASRQPENRYWVFRLPFFKGLT